jgi:hypothetical protein
VAVLTRVSYFQREKIKKNPESKQETHPLFTAEEHAVTDLSILFNFDYSSATKVGRDQLLSSFIWDDHF